MEIIGDLFDIAARVKEINPAYFIERNKKNGHFELHSHRLRPTFVLSFPFGKLDVRAVEYVLKTRVERQDQLIREIEENNLKIEREAAFSAHEKACDTIEREMKK